MIQTENFWIGFEYPRTKTHHGVIYFRGEAFANTWIQDGSWSKSGKSYWVINRDGKAFEFGYPDHSPEFNSAEEMLAHLEVWYFGLTNSHK